MFLVVRAKRLVIILCLTIFAIGSIILASNRTLVPVFTPVHPSSTHICYILDAGHGGEDSGAVAADGTLESDLNLAVADRTAQLLRFLGKDIAMTRSDQNAVYTEGAVSLREKKRSDLENRVSMVNQKDNAVLISIHQNSLPSAPSVRGAQVFYNSVEGAAPLAALIQQSLNQSVNPGNEKSERAMDASIYLMRHAGCPAVLVECGFLSNAEETQLLQQDAYQTRLAVSIAAGVLNQQETDQNGAE